MRGTSAIVGIGESAYYKPGGASETEFQLTIIAIKRALEDAGLSVKDVDGLVGYAEDRNEPNRLSAALGNDQTRFAALAWGGGGNGAAAPVALADMAITAGYADVVVAFRGLAQGQFGRFGRAQLVQRVPGERAYRAPYGHASAPMSYGIQAQRFMFEHGVTSDALAEISLASYAHAQRNPRAIAYGRPLNREDYYNSRWIADPFRLFDCCRESDGAAAVVLTSAERARDLPKPPVYVRAAAQGMERRANAGGSDGSGYNDPEFPTAHYRTVADDLWRRAGFGPSDVQVAQFYENFTGMVVMAICEMGFVQPDEVESWLKAGNIRWPDGALPINTSGGNLAEAYIHGMSLVNEGARQVRGESVCQVEDVNLSLVVAGPGAIPASTILLSKEP